MIPSKRKEMKLRTFTWNVCGLDVEHLEAKDAERLDRILARLTATDADVVCCGLVEVVDLDPGTVLRDSIKTDSVFRTRRVESWRVKCRNALGDAYTEITSGGLVGVALFVFAKPDTLVGVDVSTIATGSLGGALGNKGAVVMRMTPCKSTYFHVVHAHMASDLDQVAARNAEYAQIVNTRCVPEEHSAFGAVHKSCPVRHRRRANTAASSPRNDSLICAQVGRRDPRFAPVAAHRPRALGRFWCSRRGRRHLAGRFELPFDG